MRERLIAFGLSGVLCGIGGALAVHQSGVLNPDTFYFAATVTTMTMLVVGGARSVLGAVIGTIAIGDAERGAPGSRERRRPARRRLDRRGPWACRDRPGPEPAGGDDRDAERVERWPRGGRASLVAAAAARPAAPLRSRSGGDFASQPPLEPAARGALRAEGISLAFSGLHVLRGIDLCLEPRRGARAVGPNGAGKTTLVNVLSGFQAARCGHRRASTGSRSPDARRRVSPAHGLGRTFQAALPFPHLSCLESVASARWASEPGNGAGGGCRGRRARSSQPPRARRAAGRLAAAGEPAPAGHRPRPRHPAALPAARRARRRAERSRMRGAGRDPAPARSRTSAAASC